MSAEFRKWRQVLPAALIGATAFLASGTVMAADTAAAQAPMEEVIITGSSIAQKADQSSLPVTTLTEKDIAKTGVTSATDLIQNLPAMQGFVPASSSVNGGGGGGTTAALHSLPSKYTLVLVDGQRVAPFGVGAVQGGGTAVNIESIPLDAVERVEVLTDGASALYGADAISGVVNFILKKNRTEGSLYYNVLVPASAGGGGWNAGISKGFGDLNSDGYNIVFSYSHDVQDALAASQRAASRRGSFIPFSSGGTNYIYTNRTSNTEPANISIVATSNPNRAATSYNPFYVLNGNCGNPNAGAQITAAGTLCRFNYAATVQDIPSYKRDSGLLKGTFRVNDSSDIWAEIMVSQFDMIAQYAPPAQPMGIGPNNLPALWNTYVVPYLTAHNMTASRGTLGYRAVSAGGRTDDWGTLARHIAMGYEGKVGGWDFKSTLVVSHGKLSDIAAGGYLDFDVFNAAVASGAYDPVLGTGSSSIKSAILHSPFSYTNSDVKTLSVNAQHKLFDLDGGASILSVGSEYGYTKYKVDYSDLLLAQSGYSTQPACCDYPVGGNYGQVPFEADRDNWGVFGEWLLPFRSNLNVTASVRYDSYSKTNSNVVFSLTPDPVTGLYPQTGPAKLGNTFSQATGKLSFRYTPIDMLSFRGSIGTGFKAPNMGDIAGALAFAGSTSNSYPCPFPGSPGCIPGSAQYDLLAGPNGASGAAGLKPEKSTQWTLGVRVDPLPGLSLGLDYWSVSIKDQVESQGIAEQVAFANPSQYAGLFVNPYQDPAGFPTIALIQAPFNGGKANYSGLDWNFGYRADTSWGNFSANWTGTYMLKQEYNFGPGDPMLTDLGVYGPDQAVVFRTVSNLALSLQTGKWVNTLTGHYRSGYKDQGFSAGTDINLANPNGSLGASVAFCCLQVPNYTTLDWQTTYDLAKDLGLSFGIKNLSDKEPPLSLQTGGGGNQAGYDGRYADIIGRTYYFRGTYRF
jgi:iron complex outermembrane receptor protein